MTPIRLLCGRKRYGIVCKYAGTEIKLDEPQDYLIFGGDILAIVQQQLSMNND